MSNTTTESTVKTQSGAETGERYVYFFYTLSCIVLTLRRTSKIYCLQPGESAIKRGWPYVLISFLLGWWGFPWGPLYTVESIMCGFTGIDINEEKENGFSWKRIFIGVLLLAIFLMLGLFALDWAFSL